MATFKVWLATAAVAVGFAGTASAQFPVKGAYYPTPHPIVKPVYYPTVQPVVKNVYYPTTVPGVRVFPNTGPIVPAYSGPFVPRVDFDYVVITKRSIFAPWVRYGRFETLNQAQFAARRLELFGYGVRIEPVRDFNGFGFGW